MKKILIIAFMLALTTIGLVGCSNSAMLTALIYNSTTLEEIEVHSGETVSITGYMSISSPLDESMAYIMPQPFMTDPDVYGEGGTILPTMVAAYPPTGSKLKYTEKCITVTGTITYKSVTDTSGVTYPFYLADCTYTVYEDNGNISEYNTSIESGSLKVIDDWITAIYQGMLSPTTATEISNTTYSASLTEKLDEDAPNIKKLHEAAENLNTVYNAWVVTSPTEVNESLAAEYKKVGDTMVEWLNLLKTKGNEINEDNSNTEQP